jgi:hypothetical protein
VEEIITAGSDKARQTAVRTLEEVRAAVKL